MPRDPKLEWGGMRAVQPRWLRRLRQMPACSDADIRFNGLVGRWEFIIPGADGVPRSQFLGVFPDRGGTIDAVTGLYPFRELTDDSLEDVCRSIQATFVGNRHDGAGTPRKEIQRRIALNDAHRQAQYDRAGALFAEMFHERRRRIAELPFSPVLTDLTPRRKPKPRIEVVSR